LRNGGEEKIYVRIIETENASLNAGDVFLNFACLLAGDGLVLVRTDLVNSLFLNRMHSEPELRCLVPSTLLQHFVFLLVFIIYGHTILSLLVVCMDATVP
jgi:hypothetical protein